MNKPGLLISQLFSIRNQYGIGFSTRKLNLLETLAKERIKSKKEFQSYYDCLLFLIAYPDNKSVYLLALKTLHVLQGQLSSGERLRAALYNSGITGTQLCAAFSFEIVKWLRKNHPENIRISSFEADDGHIRYIISAVMPKVESEILQDANATWQSWLRGSMREGEEILDRLIAVFDETDMRPEIRDELWNALGVDVEIDLPEETRLPDSLFTPYYHRSLIRKNKGIPEKETKPIPLRLTESEAALIIGCGRMILVKHLREIDPVTFTSARLVSYYQLARGLSVALLGMVPERRHPIDSYMGYLVFKNGLPISYAGSWILFDSARIGLNIFPAFRGGESQYVFEQVLLLHKQVYQLNRFSVDPYQIGKENSEGIKSGAFWTYYRTGFRPIREEQKIIAEAEYEKILSTRGYRTPVGILKELAGSRMELVLQKNAMRLDATDLSIAYAGLLKNHFENNRRSAEDHCFRKLVEIIGIKNWQEERIKFILKNWCVLLMRREPEIKNNLQLKKTLKILFELKAVGSEEKYIAQVIKAGALRKLLEKIVKEQAR
jgi:hypothetical protein